MPILAARLSPHLGVMVSPDGRFASAAWDKIEELRPKLDCRDATEAQSLLDAAIFAGRQVGARGRSIPPQPTNSPIQWAINLISSYRTTRVQPHSLLVAAARLREAGHDKATNFLLKKYLEEEWHYKLALSDLKAMGFDAEALVAAVTIESAETVCEHAAAVARSGPPIGLIGIAYVGEESLAGDRCRLHLTHRRHAGSEELRHPMPARP